MTSALHQCAAGAPQASTLPRVEAELRAATAARPRLSPTGTRSLTLLDVETARLRRAKFHRDCRQFTVNAAIVLAAFAAYWLVLWAVEAIDGVVR